MVWFCSNVGGGVFGEGQVASWRALGVDARLHYAVELEDYWRGKSGGLAKLALRWAMYVRYPRMLRRIVRRAQPGELFVAVTNPFFLPALASRAARQSGAKVIHLVFDLYPDAFVFGGGWSQRHPVARLATATTRRAICDCAATVYLGERLRRYAEEQYGVAPRTAVIPVGTDTSLFVGFEPMPRETGHVRCLYSGHMGRLHEWETIFGALTGGIPSGISMEIASDGPGANALKAALAPVAQRQPERLIYAGTLGPAEWRAAMVAADVALVTMRPGAEKVVMPSKTYSAMAAGQAIVAVCPGNSDLADLVAKHDCGWVIEPGDSEALRSLLGTLSSRGEEVLQKRSNAFVAAHAYYSMQATAKQWAALFGTIHES